MKTTQALLGTILIWQGFSLVCGQMPDHDGGGTYTADPGRFEESIARFESADREAPPPPGAILGLGSSSMRMWKAIVLYEGDNDVAQGVAPGVIADTFRRFTRNVHDTLPRCRTYFLSIKPSISRWHL